MFVENITIKNFRNHSYLTYDFSNKMNIFVGENGVGKTNLIEAIYYLSLARSFKTSDDQELIQHGKQTASIDAKIASKDISHKIKVAFTKEGRKIIVDGKPIAKLSELSRLINIIIFEPKDVMIFKGLPKERRNYLDVSISKKSTPYLGYISQYEKLLKERNTLLKQDKIDETLLETLTEMMIKLSGPIVSYRQQYIKDINGVLNKIIRALTSERMSAKIIYQPFIPYDDEFEEHAKEAFAKFKETDIKKKSTSLGVHREDFIMLLNEKDISSYGSQGENRIVALALKLSPFFLIDDKDKRPVIILDDVMSELDLNNQQRLIHFLKKFEQVFITSTDLNVDEANIYTLKKKGEFINGR